MAGGILDMHRQLVHEKEVTMEDHIILPKGFADEQWYRDMPVRTLYIHSLLRAGADGSFRTSIRALARETGLSLQTLRTALAKAVRIRLLKVDTNTAANTAANTQATRVTVCQYALYKTDDGWGNTQTNTAPNTPKEAPPLVPPERFSQTLSKVPPYNPPEESSTTTTACAYAQEDDEIDAEVRQLRASQLWLEQIMMHHRITPSEIDALLSEFASVCRCNGMLRHTDINDAKRHFNAWLRIYKQNIANGNNRTSPEQNVRAAQREAILRTMQVIGGTAAVDRDVPKPF